MAVMKVLIVDDADLFVEGLQNLLLASGIEVLGIAGNMAEAFNKTEQMARRSF